jgi:hypothetical protein
MRGSMAIKFLVGSGAAVCCVFLASAQPVLAAAFNPHFIISDEEMRRADAMNFEEISTFLAKKGGLNSCFDIDAIDGLLKSTAQLIDDAAKRYRINPKYILSLIQKESSAVETDKPTAQQLDWATGYSLCDGCRKQKKYQGLATQIDYGAGWMDWYLTKAPFSPNMLQPGQSRTFSRTKVTPLNLATAALYTYTPHLHGNRLLWSIWNRWFGDGVLPRFPDGTLVRNEDNGAVALIQGGKFRPIANASVLQTRFKNYNILDLNEYDFNYLQEAALGKPVKFTDYALVRTETGDTYLLVGGSRRLIASSEAFSKTGFNPEEVEDVLAADLEEYADGPEITLASSSPFGELLQDSISGGVYYAQNGVKHALWDKALLTSNFAGDEITPVAPSELNELTTGDPVRFLDGTLVKYPDDPTVFVISNGLKRPIPSEIIFLGFGYKWDSVLTAGKKVLDLHPIGDPLLILDGQVRAAAVGI